MATVLHYRDPIDPQEIVASNIRALMGRHRVNQETLGKVIGVSRPQLSDRLSGKTNISVRELGMIARYFGKQMEDLVTLRKQGKPPLELVPSLAPRHQRSEFTQSPLLHPVRG